MEEKSEMLETPRISQFKHENLFADAFKQSTNNELLRSNSIIQESNQLTILISNTLNSNDTPLLTPLSAISNNQNTISSDTYGNISAPKKSFLFRTISQENPKSEFKLLPKLEQKISNPEKSFFNNESSHHVLENSSVHLNGSSFQKPILTKQNSLENKVKMLKEALDFSQDSDANNGELGDDNGIDETKYEQNRSLETRFKSENLDTSKNLEPNNYDKQESFMSMSVSSMSSSFDDTVTSTDQLAEQKIKKKRKSIESNTDVRKQQIRNSNREAARRCRERRRNYIETLEANIRNIESKQLALMNENNQLHKEIKNLKSILGEHKECSVTLNKRFSSQNANKSNFMNNNGENGSAGYMSNNAKEINGFPMFIKLEMPIKETNVNSSNNSFLASNINNSSIPLNSSLSNQQALQICIDALLPGSKSKTNETLNGEKH